jgi:hypothetical protein
VSFLSRLIIGTGSGDGTLAYSLAQSKEKIYMAAIREVLEGLVKPGTPGPLLQEAPAVVK